MSILSNFLIFQIISFDHTPLPYELLETKTQKVEKESTDSDNAAELELLLMDENVKKQHFNFADIVKEEQKSKKDKTSTDGDKDFKVFTLDFFPQDLRLFSKLVSELRILYQYFLLWFF